MILNNYTKKQFKEMQFKMPDGKFTDIVVVPTDDIHDSGFRCMKFVLYNCINDEIVGVVGGESDVIHFNGIGGYGKYFDLHKPQKPIGYRIDCLRESGYLRIMTGHYLEISDFICSDFDFYVGESIERKIENFSNIDFYKSDRKYNRGYADGMKRVIEMIEKIMVVEREE